MSQYQKYSCEEGVPSAICIAAPLRASGVPVAWAGERTELQGVLGFL